MRKGSTMRGGVSDAWHSLRWTDGPGGYVVSESAARFRKEIRAETAVRFVGIAAVLAAYSLWFVPLHAIGAEAILAAVLARASLSVIFGSVGLALILFATRGFRREIRVDVRDRTLAVLKLNAWNQKRASRRFAMDDIESLFVRRADRRDGLTGLYVRTGKLPQGRCLMRGDLTEVEVLHRQLCLDVRKTLRPRNTVRMHPAPKRSAKGGTPRPVADDTASAVVSFVAE